MMRLIFANVLVNFFVAILTVNAQSVKFGPQKIYFAVKLFKEGHLNDAICGATPFQKRSLIQSRTDWAQCGGKLTPCLAQVRGINRDVCDNCLLKLTVKLPRLTTDDKPFDYSVYVKPVDDLTNYRPYEFFVRDGTKSYVDDDVVLSETVTSDKIMMAIDHRIFVGAYQYCPCTVANNECNGVMGGSNEKPWIHFEEANNTFSFNSSCGSRWDDANWNNVNLSGCNQSKTFGDIRGTCPQYIYELRKWAFEGAIEKVGDCPTYATMEKFHAAAPALGSCSAKDMTTHYISKNAELGFCGTAVNIPCPIMMRGLKPEDCGKCQKISIEIPGCPPDGPLCDNAHVSLYVQLYDDFETDQSFPFNDFLLPANSFGMVIQSTCSSMCAQHKDFHNRVMTPADSEVRRPKIFCNSRKLCPVAYFDLDPRGQKYYYEYLFQDYQAEPPVFQYYGSKHWIVTMEDCPEVCPSDENVV